LSVGGGGAAVAQLPGLRIHRVVQPQPHRGRGRTAEVCTPVESFASAHLLAELHLSGPLQGHRTQSEEIVVVAVHDQTSLLEVADLVLTDVQGELDIHEPLSGWGLAEQQTAGVLRADDVRICQWPVQGAVADGDIVLFAYPLPSRRQSAVELLGEESFARLRSAYSLDDRLVGGRHAEV